MNINFPKITPRLMDSWCQTDGTGDITDEDAELTALEQQNQETFNSIAEKYGKHIPIGSPLRKRKEYATEKEPDVYMPMVVETDDDDDVIEGSYSESPEPQPMDGVEEASPVFGYSPVTVPNHTDDIRTSHRSTIPIDDLRTPYELPETMDDLNAGGDLNTPD